MRVLVCRSGTATQKSTWHVPYYRIFSTVTVPLHQVRKSTRAAYLQVHVFSLTGEEEEEEETMESITEAESMKHGRFLACHKESR